MRAFSELQKNDYQEKERESKRKTKAERITKRPGTEKRKIREIGWGK